MAFHLKRKRDGKEITCKNSISVNWNKDRTFRERQGEYPIIGNSIVLFSGLLDNWTTTVVTEILEEIETEQCRLCRFRTENSEYIWWNGVLPDKFKDYGHNKV